MCFCVRTDACGERSQATCGHCIMSGVYPLHRAYILQASRCSSFIRTLDRSLASLTCRDPNPFTLNKCGSRRLLNRCILTLFLSRMRMFGTKARNAAELTKIGSHRPMHWVGMQVFQVRRDSDSTQRLDSPAACLPPTAHRTSAPLSRRGSTTAINGFSIHNHIQLDFQPNFPNSAQRGVVRREEHT